MSWKQPGPWPPGFRQDLTYEQILKEQVRVCEDLLSQGNRDGLERAILALSASLTPRMRDAQFTDDVEDLDEEWTSQVQVLEVARKRKLAASRNGCPDLVGRVNASPSLEHLAKQFAIILALLERKKMLLKLEVEESV